MSGLGDSRAGGGGSGIETVVVGLPIGPLYVGNDSPNWSAHSWSLSSLSGSGVWKSPWEPMEEAPSEAWASVGVGDLGCLDLRNRSHRRGRGSPAGRGDHRKGDTACRILFCRFVLACLV